MHFTAILSATLALSALGIAQAPIQDSETDEIVVLGSRSAEANPKVAIARPFSFGRPGARFGTKQQKSPPPSPDRGGDDIPRRSVEEREADPKVAIARPFGFARPGGRFGTKQQKSPPPSPDRGGDDIPRRSVEERDADPKVAIARPVSLTRPFTFGRAGGRTGTKQQKSPPPSPDRGGDDIPRRDLQEREAEAEAEAKVAIARPVSLTRPFTFGRTGGRTGTKQQKSPPPSPDRGGDDIPRRSVEERDAEAEAKVAIARPVSLTRPFSFGRAGGRTGTKQQKSPPPSPDRGGDDIPRRAVEERDAEAEPKVAIARPVSLTRPFTFGRAGGRTGTKQQKSPPPSPDRGGDDIPRLA